MRGAGLGSRRGGHLLQILDPERAQAGHGTAHRALGHGGQGEARCERQDGRELLETEVDTHRAAPVPVPLPILVLRQDAASVALTLSKLVEVDAARERLVDRFA
jgi:hypothetical protein